MEETRDPVRAPQAGDEPRGPLTVFMAPGPGQTMVNPYLSMLVDGLEQRDMRVLPFDRQGIVAHRGPAVVHVHWPEMVVNRPSTRWAAQDSARFLAAVLQARRVGIPVVWTVHNLRAHDSPRPTAERILWSMFPRLVDGWVSLSRTGVGQAEQAFPALRRKRRRAIAHGDYSSVVSPPPREAARESLGLPAAARVVAMVGRIRPYKGAEELVEAVLGIDDPLTRLVVAGACPDPGLRRKLEDAADRDPRFQPRLEKLPQDAVDAVLAAADLVVLPFRAVFNSGSVILCLSSGRPVLAPRTPVFEELATEVGPGWVQLFDGPLTPARIVTALAESASLRGAPDLTRHAWAAVAREHEQLYRECLGARRDPPRSRAADVSAVDH